MVIAVDIGNSALKLASEADQDAVLRISKYVDSIEFGKRLSQFADRLGSNQRHSWHVCSVDHSRANRLSTWLETGRSGDHFHLISHDEIPLSSSVENRATLGRDRLLASWFATTRTGPETTAIVVDAGTAVTIDVAAEDHHLGGLIFPGSETCLTALESQTDALPNLASQPPPEISASLKLGNSTQQAILLGVHQLQLFGVVAMVKSLQEEYLNSQVFCCGGAMGPLASQLPPSWDHQPNFVTDAIFELSKRVL